MVKFWSALGIGQAVTSRYLDEGISVEAKLGKNLSRELEKGGLMY